MKKWNKKDGLKAIDNLINQIPQITKTRRNSSEHMRWLSNTLRIIEEIFGRDSRYYIAILSFSWSESGQMFIQEYWDVESEMEKRHNLAFIKQMNQAKGMLQSAKDHLDQHEISEVYQGKDTSPEASELIRIINLGEKKLRKVIRETPQKEKEVQDKFEDILIASEIEYSREYPHIEYSSKQYIPDFSFPKIALAVEVKFCKNSTDEKALIAQINDDILAYKTMFRNLLFIIYDLGQIRDIEKFKRSFEKHNDVMVQIIKH